VRLQHVSVAIPPDGAERARAFYGGLLGLEERDVLPKLDPARFIWFRAGDGDLELHLMLLEEPPPAQPHFCLAVDGGLARLRARLEAAGVETRDGTELAGRPRFTCRDPFGNLIELAHVGG
jgi:catechol 2,3-dioxygenase-like lactoylglutathione lyase family enzyme